MGGHLVRQVLGPVGDDHRPHKMRPARVRNESWIQGLIPCAGFHGNDELEATPGPTLFLKVLRPRMFERLKMELGMLMQATEWRLGARALLVDHWHLVNREVDLGGEQRLQ